VERIIYQTDDGVAVVIPASGFTAEQCIKDIPTGYSYKIVPTSEVLSDRTFRNAWEVDATDWETK
jgi:hypothetical protein